MTSTERLADKYGVTTTWVDGKAIFFNVWPLEKQHLTTCPGIMTEVLSLMKTVEEYEEPKERGCLDG